MGKEPTIPVTKIRVHSFMNQLNRAAVWSGEDAPEVLQTLRVPFTAGRTFNASEMTAQDTVTVTVNLARRFWPGQDPASASNSATRTRNGPEVTRAASYTYTYTVYSYSDA